eukprot:920786-Amphidinium_carterae.1
MWFGGNLHDVNNSSSKAAVPLDSCGRFITLRSQCSDLSGPPQAAWQLQASNIMWPSQAHKY